MDLLHRGYLLLLQERGCPRVTKFHAKLVEASNRYIQQAEKELASDDFANHSGLTSDCLRELTEILSGNMCYIVKSYLRIRLEKLRLAPEVYLAEYSQILAPFELEFCEAIKVQRENFFDVNWFRPINVITTTQIIPSLFVCCKTNKRPMPWCASCNQVYELQGNAASSNAENCDWAKTWRNKALHMITDKDGWYKEGSLELAPARCRLPVSSSCYCVVYALTDVNLDVEDPTSESEIKIETLPKSTFAIIRFSAMERYYEETNGVMPGLLLF